MKQLPLLGRLLTVLALMALASGLGTVNADAAGAARACTHPRFTTRDTNGMWSTGHYVVHNNMWNVGGYHVSERLRACSAGNWSVTATADNRRGDGAVKTYPNVHRDYHNWSNGHEPKLSSFRTIRSTFASRSPRVGIYDGAYDIWMNGVASSGSTEVMIWTDNHRQVPSGSVVKRGLRFSHRTWRLYVTGGHSYIAFVPNKPLHHGRIDIKKRLTFLTRHGYLPKGSTVGQVCFGYEIVSTGGSAHGFKIDRFSVSSSRR
jgi:Glycosyl hydrolase family 12